MPSDNFIGTLTCAFCHTRYPDHLVQSRIADEPGAHDFRIGDVVEITPTDLPEHSFFLPLAPLAPDTPLRALEGWRCATCGRDRWLELVFAPGGRLDAMNAIALTPEVLAQSHAIAWPALRKHFEAWTGVKLFKGNDYREPYRPDFVALLSAHLAETPE